MKEKQLHVILKVQKLLINYHEVPNHAQGPSGDPSVFNQHTNVMKKGCDSLKGLGIQKQS